MSDRIPSERAPHDRRPTERPGAPRIPPLDREDATPVQLELLDAATVPGGGASNIFATLVRAPGLFRRWLPFGGKLLAGKLADREREIAILRTGWLCQAVYEWGQHVAIGRLCGLDDDDVRRIQAGPDAAGWTELESAILRATDELHDDACVSDATWARLAEHYDEAQLIELVMLVGHYHLVSFALNSLGVQREAGVVGFDL
jgi:alkylhydroperoxidase family enzyme